MRKVHHLKLRCHCQRVAVLKTTTFLDGEEVVYKVYYNLGFFWTEAGMVHFKVQETDSSYRISASGSTAGFYDNFYRVT